MLSKWLSQYKNHKEISRLQKELADMLMERDILKKRPEATFPRVTEKMN
jgi:hypothetical protein